MGIGGLALAGLCRPPPTSQAVRPKHEHASIGGHAACLLSSTCLALDVGNVGHPRRHFGRAADVGGGGGD